MTRAFSRRTLQLLADWLELRQPSDIASIFAAAKIERDQSIKVNGVSRARRMVNQYLLSLDLTSTPDVDKLLVVFARVLIEQTSKEESPYYGMFSGFFGSRPREPRAKVLEEQLELDGRLRDVQRLIEASGAPLLTRVVEASEALNAAYISTQIRRIEEAVDSDPSLAIGTAKELIETTCKTILEKRGVTVGRKSSLTELFKATRAELELAPPPGGRSPTSETLRRLLASLATLAQGLAELRNQHGTGHGPPGGAMGLEPRHARLAAGCAATLATFLFETQQAMDGGKK
jgi:hypothetical protein